MVEERDLPLDALWRMAKEVQLVYIKRKVKEYRARDKWIDGLQNDLDDFIEWLEGDIKCSAE